MYLSTGFYEDGQIEDLILTEDSLYDYEDDEMDRGRLSRRWDNEHPYVDTSDMWA